MTKIDMTRPFEDRRKIALYEAEERCREVYEACPEVRTIDKELENTGLNIFKAAMLPDGEREITLDRLKDETMALREKRNALILSLRLPADYTSPRFVCDKCSDTGFVGYRMCSCLKEYRAAMRVSNSGLGKYLGSQTFDNFSLDFYPEKLGSSTPRERMKRTLEYCRGFAEGFDGESGESLLFVGGTGLGKTHLSGAIARRVIEKGFYVVYESAQNILADFERDRFSQSEKKPSDKYFESDLLIIDDLGTEIKGASSAAYFYTLVNTRIISSKSVIISTNLAPDALRRQYEERFVSRLFGEYQVFLFEGEDIRKLKK